MRRLGVVGLLAIALPSPAVSQGTPLDHDPRPDIRVIVCADLGITVQCDQISYDDLHGRWSYPYVDLTVNGRTWSLAKRRRDQPGGFTIYHAKMRPAHVRFYADFQELASGTRLSGFVLQTKGDPLELVGNNIDVRAVTIGRWAVTSATINGTEIPVDSADPPR